jgi:hypothetical protein
MNDINEGFLLYKENSSFLNHLQSEPINEKQIHQNIRKNVIILSFPMLITIPNLVIGIIATAVSGFVVINAFIELISQFLGRFALTSVMIGLVGIVVGLYGVFMGISHLRAVIWLMRFIFPRGSTQKIYNHLLREGEICVGNVISISENRLEYEFTNRRGETKFSSYTFTSDTTHVNYKNVLVLYTDIVSVLL